MNEIKNKIKGIGRSIKMIFSLAINDLKKRYSGSIGGFLWAYIQPLVAILVFWFVFEKGFRNSPVDGTPFILWLVPSYISWTYINDSCSQSTNVLFEYNFLVKKVKFDIRQLPLVKVCVSLIIHLFFILFCYALYAIYGIPFNLTWLQVFYYTFAMSFLLVGISLLNASLSVFLKDFAQIINVLLQIGFWMTPVFWNPDTMNKTVVEILKLNPFFYVVSGYRDCFIGNVMFYEHYWQTAYFWIVSIVIFVIGYGVFKKLSRHFSDLL